MASKKGPVFDDDVKGLLMMIKPSNVTRYEYHIWFKYDKSSMNKIQEGTLIGIENFASDKDKTKFSVVSVSSVMPKHYAIASTLEGLPVFTEEAAESSSLDWDQEKPIEDTTRIYCTAVPYNMQIEVPSALKSKTLEPTVGSEENLPMVGRKARIITSEWVELLYNKNLQTKQPGEVIDVGTLPRDDKVDILVDWEELVRTHFGIFAYTKAGKSNLLSTSVSKMVDRANSLKVLVFDIMTEYSVLLADTLVQEDEACVLCLDTDIVPNSVVAYWRDPTDANLLTAAATDLANTSLYPGPLESLRNDFVAIFRNLLENNKYRLFLNATTFGIVIQRARAGFGRTTWGGRNVFEQFIQDLIDDNQDTEINQAQHGRLTGEINDFNEEPGGDEASEADHKRIKKSSTYQSCIVTLRTALRRAFEDAQASAGIDPRFLIDDETMMDDLMDDGSKSLYVIQSDDDSFLRTMSFNLGMTLLRRRKFEGRRSPPTSFVFDEADLFIPQKQSEVFGETGFDQSRAIATEIARRGRKFGVGIAIATQRITYLDTSILGQPHTYFVSKLPRFSDREKVGQAFGLSDETMIQTLRFSKGQWLLVSYDATGVEGFPVPVQLPDANVRIREFVTNYTP